MVEVRKTSEFQNWLTKLRDQRAVARITTRIARVEAGLMGDVKYFDGIGELRVDYGPGYRVYFAKRGQTIIILLCGGDKRTQKRDIKNAVKMAKEV
jgi:putative addiction module killer protein